MLRKIDDNDYIITNCSGLSLAQSAMLFISTGLLQNQAKENNKLNCF